MDNNGVFEQDFVSNYVENNPHAIEYELKNIAEVHSPEYGWSMGEPTITPNSDGKTVTIKVHLTKVNTESVGRGR